VYNNIGKRNEEITIQDTLITGSYNGDFYEKDSVTSCTAFSIKKS